MIGGYFDRDEMLEQYLSDFNERFPMSNEVATRLTRVFDFIDECGFLKNSRIWKRSDLFSLIVSLDRKLFDDASLSPTDVVRRLEEFYAKVENEGMTSSDAAVVIYAKAAIQASNDKINRIRRGVIIESVLVGSNPVQELRNEGLLI